ncbi:hypothetical protein GGX14DRAFT_378748 [Mycena pura]|uniref:Uncharacterized protein n=1 Tax=Mycena pura TaxID=153505 RepID=A0AAD6Y2P7_9AGAR|nr:hypothetical protein GGX14DRAFT_378748 [Mycena pura]
MAPHKEELFTCLYCPAARPTRQGLRSHLHQSVACSKRYYAEFLGGDSSDSESQAESEPDEPPSSPTHSAGALDWDVGLQGYTEEDSVHPPAPVVIAGSGAAPALAAGKRQRATVEEVDEDDRWTCDYPEKREAGKQGAPCKSQYQQRLDEQTAAGREPWYPFASKAEWEFGRWLMTCGVSQSKIEELLKLDAIKPMNLSFHNTRAFLQRIDAIPAGPEWICHPFQLTGDEKDDKEEFKHEIVELWYRDPVECVRELLGNPMLANQGYEPCRVFRAMDNAGNLLNQEYSEMWTADWWWETQDKLPDGATLCPIILASDKTQLTRFSGDKQAWPVYLTIETGVNMNCADGFVRHIFLILAAYIADYPEQCLVACCRENSCPRCLCGPKQRGDTLRYPWRDPEATLSALDAQANEHPAEFLSQNLRPVLPFWSDLPHCDIFTCFTPDLLHEIHNGVFGDHIVSWSSAATDGVGPEIDQRFRSMTPHPSLRHFNKGITLTSQWTGTEHKNMEKVYLGVLANATDPRVIRAVRGIFDFTCYAHFETHTTESLALMDLAWAAFHDNKAIFLELEIRKHFDINKLHKLKHYTDSIRSRGTCGQFNTEHTERLHIDFAKLGYRASNRRAYIKQMAVWLRRQEAIQKFHHYLEWAVPGYVKEESDEDGSDSDDSDEVGLQQTPDAVVHSVAKTPPYSSLTATSIAADFHAPHFLLKLAAFLDSRSIRSPHELSASSTFPVYKRLSITLPRILEVGSRPIRDKVRAVPAKITASKGVQAVKPAQFDTVLARTDSELTPADFPSANLRACRVRVIFQLPVKYGRFSHPLAYVDWFRPLTQIVDDLGMYKVTLATRNNQQHSSVIPISAIVRSCQLIPIFGNKIDPTWTSALVLDQSKAFYLNPYLRHLDFHHLRYLPDLAAARKKEDDRRVRMRALGRAGRR